LPRRPRSDGLRAAVPAGPTLKGRESLKPRAERPRERSTTAQHLEYLNHKTARLQPTTSRRQPPVTTSVHSYKVSDAPKTAHQTRRWPLRKTRGGWHSARP
jgi:hypothetical protein